jgi:hypothetical protein
MREVSKLSSLADQLWTLSLEELRHFQGVITKILTAKEAVAEAEGLVGDSEDRATAVALKETREYLGNPKVKFSGPESVILASYHLQEEGSEWLESKRLNILLDSYERKPSNSTSIIDKLIARGMMELEDGRPHSHKKFQLTDSGREESWEILARVRSELKGGGKLSVVG